MAKIRINGDTSGYIEISAPAVAGSTSITLPATTGGSLLATDANGNLNVDSGTLYVDASNNRVGVGTSSPSNNFQVTFSATAAVPSAGASGNCFAVGSSAYGITGGALTNGNSYFQVTRWDGTATNYDLLLQPNGGRVGIGTTSPAVKLDVNGDIFASGGDIYTGANRMLSSDSTIRPLIFGIGAGEKARIDSSGRLLVGTSSDSQTSTLVLQGNSGASNDASLIRLCRGTNAPADGAVLGYLVWGDSGHTAAAWVAGVRDGGTWTSGTSQPTRLVFSTTADGASSPTERMRIKSNGHLQVTTDGGFGGLDGVSHGFRTTTANWVAQFMNDQITGTNNYGVQIKYVSSAPNGTGNSFLLCGDSAADRVQLRSNGGLANYQANDVNLSDRNAKKDIVPAAGTWDCIKEWEIVNYRYKDQPDDSDLNLGVIAQQVAESCPEVITVFEEAKDDQPEKLGVKEQQMYWMAIKALQEAQLRIEQLEATNASFEARLSALEVKP